MKMGARQRWIALIFLLMLALTAAAWVRETEKESVAEVVEAPARTARPQRSAQPARPAPERVALEKLRGHAFDANNTDPFAARSWRKPPAPVIPAAGAAVAATPPPPPPSAPPLPFTYLGRLLSEEANAVFLTQGERNLVIHEGDVIDSLYRVDRFADTQILLTHLPTGIQQTLVTGNIPGEVQ